MSKTQGKKGHGGARKIGRNKVKCENYRRLNRRYHNKLKKWIKHNIGSKDRATKINEFDEIQDKRKKK